MLVDNLRPIKVTGMYNKETKRYDKEYVGKFHKWSICGDANDGIETVAIIELDDGTIIEPPTFKCKFLDRSSENE